METSRIHHISSRIVLALSFIALFTVLTGYFQAPQPDEGTGAHIFQLAVVLLCPALLLFLVTADWRHAGHVLRVLIPASLALGAAFAALYYLEHFWYVQAALRHPR